MGRKTLYALLLIAAVVVVLITNTRGLNPRIDVNLLVTEVSIVKSLVFLAFTAIGVVIGVLLK